MRIALLISLGFLASCSAPQFTAEASYGMLAPDGDVGLSSSGTSAAKQSLSSLGIDDSEATLAARADFKWGMPHLTVGTQSTSWDGSATLAQDFGDLSAGEAVSTQLDLALHRAALTWDLAPTDNLELGIGLGVLLVDLQAVADPDNPTLEDQELDAFVPLPTLAARAGGRLGPIDLEALLSGIRLDLDGDEASYLDFDARLKYAFFGSPGSLNGSLVLGWRSTSIALSYDDDTDNVDTDLSFSGVYLGLQVGI